MNIFWLSIIGFSFKRFACSVRPWNLSDLHVSVLPALVGPESMNNQSCPPGHGGKFLFFPNYLIKHLNRMLMLCESDKCLSVLKHARFADVLFMSVCLLFPLFVSGFWDWLLNIQDWTLSKKYPTKKLLLRTCLYKCLYYDLQLFLW